MRGFKWISGLASKLRPAPNYGHVAITPYTTLWHGFDEPPPHLKLRAEQIAQRLDEFQERMVAHHRANVPTFGTLRLQQITGTWDIASDRIQIIASGDRYICRQGAVDDFLGNSPTTDFEMLEAL
mgnify:CR=1 FL=1